MLQIRALMRRLRFIAVTFCALVLLGILVSHWHPQIAQAAEPRVTVSNTTIRTTTPITITERQTVAVTNVADLTALIYSDGAGSVIATSNASSTTTSAAITLAAGQTVTLQFTQPGVYHLMSSNTSGGEETITVTA